MTEQFGTSLRLIDREVLLYEENYLYGVFRKARLILDEEGTRAAAATIVIMTEGACLLEEEPPVQFNMNRPFVFVIADEVSGAVCFAGIVANPVGN